MTAALGRFFAVIAGLWLAGGALAQSLMPPGQSVTPLMANVQPLGLGGGRIDGTGPMALATALPPVTPLGQMPMLRRGVPGPNSRCSADGQRCINLESYVPDVCRAIAQAAREAALDPHYFARLLWRESRFNANAVSHAGAQGIAQFMPPTARERGLSDPFNPAMALPASAKLLVDLKHQFGNLGLAAAAYNAGPGRVAKFVAGRSGLPKETRDYVAAITGHSAVTWRDRPPKPDYRLDGSTPFHIACETMASGRGIAEFKAPESRVAPRAPKWAVTIATHRSPDILARRVKRLQRRLPEALRSLETTTHRVAPAEGDGAHSVARYEVADASAARSLCDSLKDAGVSCTVDAL